MEACLLPQLIGWGKTRELVFTGRHIDAAEAMTCHLVERLAPADKLDAAINDWVGAILTAGPNAIRAQKELVRDRERSRMRLIKESERWPLRMVQMRRNA